METLEQVWWSSRFNIWTWVYYGVNLAGIAGIYRVARRPMSDLRALKTISLIGAICFAALLVSGARIQRKWQLRQEWVVAHKDQITEEEQLAAFGDGANLIAGPPLDATITLFVLLVTTGICLFRSPKPITEPPVT